MFSTCATCGVQMWGFSEEKWLYLHPSTDGDADHARHDRQVTMVWCIIVKDPVVEVPEVREGIC